MTKYDVICYSIRNAALKVRQGEMTKEDLRDHLKNLSTLKEGCQNG